MAMLDRMKTGRLKVFAHLADWFEEFRLYHRKDGLIVKERDDLISATRVGLMMLRQASSPEDVLTAPHAADGDYDPLSGAPVSGRVGWKLMASRHVLRGPSPTAKTVLSIGAKGNKESGSKQRQRIPPQAIFSR